MPQILERMIKVRDIIRIRKKSPSQPQIKRNVIEKTRDRMDKLSTRIQERKPQVLSKANEALGTWQPGSRLTKVTAVDFGKRRTAKEKTKEMDFSMSVQTT